MVGDRARWRAERPEALKEHSPPALGRVLGLDRAPEVKTLRRKLEWLATEGGAERFGRLLAQRRVSESCASSCCTNCSGPPAPRTLKTCP